jgi:hypothetical protein
VKIALYRASGSTGKWRFVDHAVDCLSGNGGFAHAELVDANGRAYSSTLRDEGIDSHGLKKPNGTRAKFIEFDPEKWVFIDLPAITLEQERRAERWFFTPEVIDARYDFAGVGRFVLPFMRAHPRRYFCSELVVDMIRAVNPGALPTDEASHKISPNTLAKILNLPRRAA